MGSPWYGVAPTRRRRPGFSHARLGAEAGGLGPGTLANLDSFGSSLAALGDPDGLAPAQNYQVFVVYDEPGGDRVIVKSGRFEVEPGDGGHGPLVVTAPAAGDVVTAGTTLDILWDPGTVPHSTPLTLNLRRPGSGNLRIVRDTPNDGAFSWDVPSGLEAADDYQVFVIYDDAVGDQVIVKSDPFSAVALASGRAGLEAAVAFGLAPVRPNPVVGRAAVRFGLEEPSAVRVSVHDALGREVAVLTEGPMEAGWYESDVEAGSLAAGTYVVRLTAGGRVAARVLTVAR